MPVCKWCFDDFKKEYRAQEFCQPRCRKYMNNFQSLSRFHKARREAWKKKSPR